MPGKAATEYLVQYPNTKLVIIDPLQKVHRTDGTDGRNGMYGSDYNDISALKRIADQFGIAVVLVHHLRKLKDSRDPFNPASGTTGTVDTTLVLNKDERSANTAVLLANNVPLKQIQEWLGHSDFSTTANTCAHLDYRSKLSSAKAMVDGLKLPEVGNFSSKWVVDKNGQTAQKTE